MDNNHVLSSFAAERGEKEVTQHTRPIANSLLVLREEFDDWAVLFDPDSGDAFGMNPVGVFVWKRLDGKHDEEDIARELAGNCDDMPPDAREHIREFMNELVQRGFAGQEVPRP
jgi:SynChlorMet cassette protein ScmD